MTACTECEGTRFAATYQAWVTSEVDLSGASPAIVGTVDVDGGEMHGDWLTWLSCVECGERLDRDQEGVFDADGERVGSTVADHNPGLGEAWERVADLYGTTYQAPLPLAWAGDDR